MRHAAIVAVAVVLWRAHPAWFAWNATGFHTLLLFLAAIVVATIVPVR